MWRDLELGSVRSRHGLVARPAGRPPHAQGYVYDLWLLERLADELHVADPRSIGLGGDVEGLLAVDRRPEAGVRAAASADQDLLRQPQTRSM